jgi:hypothetical protein
MHYWQKGTIFCIRANVSHDIAVFLVSRAGHHGAAFSFVSRSFSCEPACGSALHTKNSPLLPSYEVSSKISLKKAAI